MTELDEQVELEFRRAIELSPGYATAHQWYAELLAGLGRFDQAIAEIDRARELDPLSPIMNSQVGYILYLARRYDAALEQLRKTVDMDPSFCLAHTSLGWVYEQKRMFQVALVECREALDLCGDTHGEKLWLAHAYALAGQSGQARRILAESEGSSRRVPVRLPYLALVYLVLGDKEHALDVLKEAIEQHAAWPGTLRSPAYDAFLSDPQSAALLRRAGLVQ